MHPRWFLLFIAGCLDEPEVNELTSEVSVLVLEGEASTGAGVVEGDATASDNAVLAMATPYTVAQQPFTTTGVLTAGSVRVRGDACSPWVRVQIDNFDVVVAQLTTTSWTTLPFSPASIPAGSHTIKFHYRYGAPGCVLRIDQATLTTADPPPPPPPPPSPMVVEAEAATGAGTVVADGSASGGAYRAFTSQYTHAVTTFTTPTTMKGRVRVRAASCTSAPWVKVYVDNTPVLLGTVTSTSWVDLPLGNTLFGGGMHTIDFEYRSGFAPCQLHIDQATFVVP
ncbi:MAG TPA: hypothetical protein VIU61_00395 [Kofleriaceae bacterium]